MNTLLNQSPDCGQEFHNALNTFFQLQKVNSFDPEKGEGTLLDSNPVPFTLGNPKKVIRPTGTCVRHRKAVWNTGTSASFPSDLFE